MESLHTWRPTLNRLVQRSDVVIMDLRAFSSKRQGCAWELTQLFETILLDRVVLVIDDTTDQPLRACLGLPTSPTSSPLPPELAIRS